MVLKSGEHFDLIYDWDVNVVFGIRIEFPAYGTEEGQRILAEAADAGVYTRPMSLDDILMLDENYETLLNNVW